MQEPTVIDADYEVIFDPRPCPVSEWTFWGDDFPNLVGIVCAVVTVAVVSRMFGYGP